MNELSTTDQAERAEIDATLKETLQSTNRHIEALYRCNKKKLWQSTHPSFESYCAEHSFLKQRAIYSAIEAETIRKELIDDGCSTAALWSDRTALTLGIVKRKYRKKTAERASQKAGPKPVTPKHIQSAAPKGAFSNYSSNPTVNTSIYTSTPKETPTPLPPAPPPPSKPPQPPPNDSLLESLLDDAFSTLAHDADYLDPGTISQRHSLKERFSTTLLKHHP